MSDSQTTALQPSQVYGSPPCARVILADALGITQGEAGDALIALFRGGFFLAPMEPTNSMLIAYINALPTKPRRNDSVLAAVAKARLRWRAMGEAGNKVAMSERGGMVDAADLNSAAEVHAGSSPAARPNGGVHA